MSLDYSKGHLVENRLTFGDERFIFIIGDCDAPSQKIFVSADYYRDFCRDLICPHAFCWRDIISPEKIVAVQSQGDFLKNQPGILA